MRLASCASPPYGLCLGDWSNGGAGGGAEKVGNLGKAWENDGKMIRSTLNKGETMGNWWTWCSASGFVLQWDGFGDFFYKALGLKARLIWNWEHAPWGIEKRAVETISANIPGLNKFTFWLFVILNMREVIKCLKEACLCQLSFAHLALGAFAMSIIEKHGCIEGVHLSVHYMISSICV